MFLQPLIKSQDTLLAKEIYLSSFPKDEIRNYDLVEQMAGKENFEFFVVYLSEKESQPIGIISLWRFEEFLFIEHFAIEKSLRNKGYGSKIITKVVQDNSLPIIIEVEPPITQKALKRIEFYKKLDFSLLNFYYLQPAYSKTQNPIELRLMTNDKEWFKTHNIEKAVSEIHKKVYKVL